MASLQSELLQALDASTSVAEFVSKALDTTDMLKHKFSIVDFVSFLQILGADQALVGTIVDRTKQSYEFLFSDTSSITMTMVPGTKSDVVPTHDAPILKM